MTSTIPNWLSKRAYLTPDRIAIRYENKQLTFKQLYEKTVTVAKKINSLNVKKGSFVSVLLKNDLNTVLILLALQMSQYKTVMLNNRLTRSELAYQIQDSNSELLIVADQLLQQSETINNLIPSLQIASVTEVLSLDESNFKIEDNFDLSEICTIMYTSGTTGNPKGVIQTYGNHWWSAIGSVLNLGLREDDCWLLAVPLFHISGYSILIRALVYGITIDLHRSFNEEAVNKAIINNKVTIVSVVSAMLGRLIADLESKNIAYPKTFRCMLLGGGPAPRPLLEKCLDLNIPVFQTYGMTETSSQIVTLSPEDSINKLGSAGKPLFPAEVKIVNSFGERVGDKVAGEIVVKGPNVTGGYLNLESGDFLSSGWLKTGDIGYFDEAGYLYVLDRRTDLIISGGENVYPAEIEAAILEHEAVLDVGVTGVEHSEWGQVPAAFVVLKENVNLSTADLIKFCESKLAKYKIPKDIYFRSELPRNAANKLMRRKLK